MNLKCLIAGHKRGAWFKTVAGACSQHPFADGLMCYRCGELLAVYAKDGVTLLNQRHKTTAPLPMEN